MKKSVEFLWKVNGNFSPRNLQKVLLVGHPSDVAQRQQIMEEILSLFDCAVFWHEDLGPLAAVDVADLDWKLREMKLFVVVVTSNFLYKENLGRSYEYRFAMEKHIPILPVAMERGLEECFTMQMKQIGSGYGKIQLLRHEETSLTEIPYQQKLYRDLSSILIPSQTIRKIRNAFSGQIFLSYRKKDRKYANELIRRIHSIPTFQQMSIWYDEFLSSGEAWDDQILDALQSSDLFLLMVTPAMSEPGNYVIREEYPAAVKQGLDILPVREAVKAYTEEQIQVFKTLFPGLKRLVDGEDTAVLEQELQRFTSTKNMSKTKQYLIGIAFLNGIGVEKDPEKACVLLLASAKSGLPQAMNKAAEMYWNGDGVARDYIKAIQWRKNLVNWYQKNARDNQSCSSRKRSEQIQALSTLCENLCELGMYRDALFYAQQLVDVTEQLAGESYWEEITAAYDQMGTVLSLLGSYQKAAVFYKKLCMAEKIRYDETSRKLRAFLKSPGCTAAKARRKAAVLEEHFYDLSVGYERLGNVLYEMWDMESAEACFCNALQIRETLYDEQQTRKMAEGVAFLQTALGNLMLRKNNFEAAEEWYSKNVALWQRVRKATDGIPERRAYGEALLGYSKALLLQQKLDVAEAASQEVLQLFQGQAERYRTLEWIRSYSTALNLSGKIAEEKNDFPAAARYYTVSLECRRDILKRVTYNGGVYDCALSQMLLAQVNYAQGLNRQAKQGFDEVLQLLRPILPNDQNQSWHILFSQAAFERFQLDTFSGEPYLRDAIQTETWLAEHMPDETDQEEHRKQQELYARMYNRCYPASKT